MEALISGGNGKEGGGKQGGHNLSCKNVRKEKDTLVEQSTTLIEQSITLFNFWFLFLLRLYNTSTQGHLVLQPV